MKSIFDVFRSGKSLSPKDPEPNTDQDRVLYQPVDLPKGTSGTTPHIVPPREDPNPRRKHASARENTMSTRNAEPGGRFVTLEDLNNLDAEQQKIDAAFTAAKKVAEAKNARRVEKAARKLAASKYFKTETYGIPLKRLMGVEPEYEDGDDMSEEDSNSDGELEKALINARSLGF